jgi:acetyltransferase-like isoleucine patch superfamily enzyme
MLRKLLVNIACFIRIDRIQDIMLSLVLESRRRAHEKILRHKLIYIKQGDGGINLAGDVRKLSIGENSHLKSNTFIECSGGVTIGKYFHSARGLTIFSTRHIWKEADKIPYSAEIEFSPVTIGDCVWAGVNVTILPGTTIGNGAILGAGAVVRGNIPDGAIMVGNPASIVAFRDSKHFEKKYADQAFF